MSNFTYKTEAGVYDVELLNDEAKITYNYLVEVQQELDTLAKRSNVLLAAKQTFITAMNNNLDEEALVTEED
jgi:hypothetical protein|tara:strand:- start:1359 stop:1574 length:216 start_codon:yes stop_codon:yes gene_type:complete